MICSSCNQTTDVERTVYRDNRLLKGCDQCLPAKLQQGTSAKYYREAQKRDFRRELTQPWQPEYAKAYPEKAREEWGDELYRKYG